MSRLTLLFALLLAAPVLAEEPPLDLERMHELVDRLADPAQRPAALAELTRLCARAQAERAMEILVFEDSGGEVMTGTAEEEGKDIRYTLKSRGKGLYRLQAVVRFDDGTDQKIDAEGKLGDLRKKYEFLGEFVIFTPGRVSVRAATPFFAEAFRMAVPALGVTLSSPSPALRHHLDLPEGVGLVVESVAKGSRAEQLGLQRFDVLVELDAKPLTDAAALKGTGVLEYVRKTKRETLELR